MLEGGRSNGFQQEQKKICPPRIFARVNCDYPLSRCSSWEARPDPDAETSGHRREGKLVSEAARRSNAAGLVSLPVVEGFAGFVAKGDNPLE